MASFRKVLVEKHKLCFFETDYKECRTFLLKFCSGIADDRVRHQLQTEYAQGKIKTFKDAYRLAFGLESNLKKSYSKSSHNEGTSNSNFQKRKRNFPDERDPKTGNERKGYYQGRNRPHNFKKARFNQINRNQNYVPTSEVLIKLFDHLHSAQLDSGATNSFISLDLCKELKLNVKKAHRQEAATLADGSLFRTIGIVTLPVYFDKEPLIMSFQVASKLALPLIIGRDMMHMHNINLNFSDNIVWVGPKAFSMNRSELQAALQTNILFSIESHAARKRAFVYQYIYKDMSSEYDEHSSLIQHPDLKPSDNSVQDVKFDSNLTINEKLKLKTLLQRNLALFGTDTISKVKTRHYIRTTCSQPVKAGIPRMSRVEIDICKSEIDDMLSKGVIRPSNSEWRSAVVMVPKPDDTVRFCVNYKPLNKVTKFDNYPLPNLQSLLGSLHGAKYFASLDLKSGYWQIPLHPDDCEKTAFVTPFGLYEFIAMPFGLASAPATFQRMMDEIFSELIGKELLIYLDDILIFGSTFEQLLDRIKEVFRRLKECGLKLKAKKCTLGFEVSAKGIHASPEKTDAVANLREPQSVTEIRQFLGLTGFYRCFIHRYASIAKPLSDLTKKNSSFQWSEDKAHSFKSLKKLIIEAPVLAHPDYSGDFSIYTDASKVGVGAVLTQNQRPVWFSSRSLQGAELNYDTREKECLAILHALDKSGHTFTEKT